MKDTNDYYISMELHAKGHSSCNFERQEEQVNWIKGSDGLMAKYSQESFERLQTRNQKCNEKGTSKPHDCINELYMKMMNCSFPWIENHSLPKCESKQDLATLINLITSGNETVASEYKKMDCSVPNCVKIHWEAFNSKNHDEKFKIELYFETWDVSTISEYRLYGMTNFLSDFGGYLGLLLGYSLLSVIKSLTLCINN